MPVPHPNPLLLIVRDLDLLLVFIVDELPPDLEGGRGHPVVRRPLVQHDQHLGGDLEVLQPVLDAYKNGPY